MTTKLHIFVSSVQKELEDERLIVQNLVNTDAFLSSYCTPVLYELEPASPGKALDGCPGSVRFTATGGERTRNTLHDSGAESMIYRFSIDEGPGIIDGQSSYLAFESIDNLSTKPNNLSTVR